MSRPASMAAPAIRPAATTATPAAVPQPTAMTTIRFGGPRHHGRATRHSRQDSSTAGL